ncbi:MAG: RNA polymerase sigma-70 factor [Draconibacterium sp.]|nr:RNA polymerase sigma-70 factor [Draconibacterium sp.]
MQNENDKLLVSLLKKNEVKAFDALFQKYSDKLFHFSFSLLKNSEDSKEIVQESFFRIWNKRNEIDSFKSFKSYLFTISYHLVIDQLRLRLKDKEYRSFLQEYFDLGDDSLNSTTDFDTLNKRIELAVSELPEKRKQIYLMSRENGLSHKEIAEKLSINVKTVENQIGLAIKHIKLSLGNDFLPMLLLVSLFY